MTRRPLAPDTYPFFQTMTLTVQAAADLRELTSYGPMQIKGRSIINTATRGDEEKQRIATPWAFIHALEQRFGVPVDFDLAAEAETSKAVPLEPPFDKPPFVNGKNHFNEADDALKQSWELLEVPRGRDMVLSQLAYCNPPFAHIRPWALNPGKLADCRWLKRWTVMLVPASYSTDWFLELRGKVQLDAIPRIQFEGATHLYPKDLVLCVAGFGVAGAGYWDWRVSYWQYCVDRKLEPDPRHLKGLKRIPSTPVLPDFNWTPDPFFKP